MLAENVRGEMQSHEMCDYCAKGHSMVVGCCCCSTAAITLFVATNLISASRRRETPFQLASPSPASGEAQERLSGVERVCGGRNNDPGGEKRIRERESKNKKRRDDDR